MLFISSPNGCPTLAQGCLGGVTVILQIDVAFRHQPGAPGSRRNHRKVTGESPGTKRETGGRSSPLAAAHGDLFAQFGEAVGAVQSANFVEHPACRRQRSDVEIGLERIAPVLEILNCLMSTFAECKQYQ
jgi:hypothetical protein